MSLLRSSLCNLNTAQPANLTYSNKSPCNNHASNSCNGAPQLKAQTVHRNNMYLSLTSLDAIRTLKKKMDYPPCSLHTNSDQSQSLKITSFLSQYPSPTISLSNMRSRLSSQRRVPCRATTQSQIVSPSGHTIQFCHSSIQLATKDSLRRRRPGCKKHSRSSRRRTCALLMKKERSSRNSKPTPSRLKELKHHSTGLKTLWRTSSLIQQRPR